MKTIWFSSIRIRTSHNTSHCLISNSRFKLPSQNFPLKSHFTFLFQSQLSQSFLNRKTSSPHLRLSPNTEMLSREKLPNRPGRKKANAEMFNAEIIVLFAFRSFVLRCLLATIKPRKYCRVIYMFSSSTRVGAVLLVEIGNSHENCFVLRVTELCVPKRKVLLEWWRLLTGVM